MQGNSLYTNQYPMSAYTPCSNPNAVSINIYSPQAYGNTQCPVNPINNQGFYPLYGPNIQQGMPIYPQNYNNMFYQQKQNPQLNGMNALGDNNGVQKTPQPELNAQNNTQENKTQNKEEEKVVVPLNDEYIKSLENYLNDSNPKVRLIGAKELMQRFKEDENRKDNPSLIPLLNKTLRDTSAAVRFLGLTTLQLGYSVGNDETVQILKEIQTQNKDKTGEDQLLASEILLKMAAPQEVAVGG